MGAARGGGRGNLRGREIALPVAVWSRLVLWGLPPTKKCGGLGSPGEILIPPHVTLRPNPKAKSSTLHRRF